MKNHKKTMTTLLTTAVLLIAVFMAGCTKLSESPNTELPEGPNTTPLEVDTQAKSDELGVYVKLERSDVRSVSLDGGNFTKACKNADGSLLETGEWLFFEDDIAQLSVEENCSVLFTVRAWDADDTLLGEGTFFTM